MNHNVKLICSYNTCTAHQLHRQDWTAEQNQKVFGHCANVHGHQYRIELHLQGEISQDTGMVINAYDVDAIVQPFLAEKFDHKFLNADVTYFQDIIPSAENIAVWMFSELKTRLPQSVNLIKLRICETPEVIVEYPVC